MRWGKRSASSQSQVAGGGLAGGAGDLLRLRLCLELLCGDDVGCLAEENDFGLLEIATGVC